MHVTSSGKKLGRPTLAARLRRDAVLSLRLTSRELDTLCHHAALRRQSLGDALREGLRHYYGCQSTGFT